MRDLEIGKFYLENKTAKALKQNKWMEGRE